MKNNLEYCFALELPSPVLVTRPAPGHLSAAGSLGEVGRGAEAFCNPRRKLDESLAARVAERLMGWAAEVLFKEADVYEVLRTVSTRDYGAVG